MCLTPSLRILSSLALTLSLSSAATVVWDNLVDWFIASFINGDGTLYEYDASKVTRRFYRLTILP
jgi:hypothetical protein